ncbi:hypothetical protein K504DRAFT_492641, partial [Pleomassaria siparia CBS 279.74]
MKNEVPCTSCSLLEREFFSLMAIPTSKTSFAVALFRLSVRQWQKWLLWFIIASMNITMWLCGIPLFLQCSPIERNWDKTKNGSCWTSKVQDNYSISAGIVAAIKTSFLPGVGDFSDMTFQIVDLLIWSDAETAVTILAASIPFFRVLIRDTTTKGGINDPYRQSYRLESGENINKSMRN